MGAKLVAVEDGWRIEGAINYKTVVALRRKGERYLEQSFQQNIKQGQSSSCCFDFSTVSHVNTSALSLLLCWRRKAKALGVGLKFIAIPSELVAIAQMSDLSELFDGSDGCAVPAIS